MTVRTKSHSDEERGATPYADAGSHCSIPGERQAAFAPLVLEEQGTTVQHPSPFACFWLWNLATLCQLQHSRAFKMPTQLSKPDRKNMINLGLLPYSYNCLSEWAPTLAQRSEGRTAIPLPLSHNKKAGSAEHRAATQESTSHPLHNQPAGQEERWLKSKAFCRSGTHHTNRAQHTLGSHFLTLFLPQCPDYQRWGLINMGMAEKPAICYFHILFKKINPWIKNICWVEIKTWNQTVPSSCIQSNNMLLCCKKSNPIKRVFCTHSDNLSEAVKTEHLWTDYSQFLSLINSRS